MHGAARHSQEDFALIAEKYTILRTEVGSGAHGIAIEGTDDRDEMGICIEPAQYVIGLKTGEGKVPFEQYLHRTQPEGQRSGPGDLDLIVFSLRKWMKLALGGNPSVLLPLFTPDDTCPVLSALGAQLRASADRIVSKRAGYQFLGYLGNQRESMLGIRKPKVNRPELVDKYGYDTKYASHAVRLGYQGIELMLTGALTLPMKTHQRGLIRTVKTGGFAQDETLNLISSLAKGLEGAITASVLPESPDYEWADEFLIRAYTETWAS